LTVALRGDAEVVVEVRTLAAAKHSGEFGGPAPDALVVLLHALATLHDGRGDVAVAGLRREPWDGASYTDDEFRELAEVEPGLPLFGTGSLGERLWSGPALTVVGIDVPSVEQAVNAVIPHARAKLNLRVHPEQDAGQAQAALIRHLESLRPFGVPLTVEAGDAGNGFAAATSGPAYEAARAALRTAWGSDPVTMASGGSIPLLNALHEAVPDAEILLFGAEDGQCNLHAPNERVLLSELERAVVAEAEFFRQYSTRRESDDDRHGHPAN
jgi:acetylornithine deacetylase/succinyl-diaminopimelate desuccinylase-like protein